MMVQLFKATIRAVYLLFFFVFLRVETAKREMFSQNSVRWFALICHRSTTPGFSNHFLNFRGVSSSV